MNINSMSLKELLEAKMEVDAKIAENEEISEKLKEQMEILELAEECYKTICKIVLKKGIAFYNLTDSRLEEICWGSKLNKFKVAKALKKRIIDSDTITFGCNPKNVSPDYMFSMFARIRIVPKTQ